MSPWKALVGGFLVVLCVEIFLNVRCAQKAPPFFTPPPAVSTPPLTQCVRNALKKMPTNWNPNDELHPAKQFPACVFSNVYRFPNNTWFTLNDDDDERTDIVLPLVSRCYKDRDPNRTDCRLQSIRNITPQRLRDELQTPALVQRTLNDTHLLLHHLFPSLRRRTANDSSFICFYHFGHELMDHLFPAFQTLRTFQLLSEEENVHVVFDDCQPDPNTAGRIWWDFLGLRTAAGSVEQLAGNNATVLHFRRLVVGLGPSALISSPIMGPGEFQRLRDHVLQTITARTLHQVVHAGLLTAVRRYTACVIDRRVSSGRTISNLAEVVALLRAELAQVHWSVEVLYLETLTRSQQVLTISTCKLMIGVAGTGMHQVFMDCVFAVCHIVVNCSSFAISQGDMAHERFGMDRFITPVPPVGQ